MGGELERKRRAPSDCTAGMTFEIAGHRSLGDDRISPFVEFDELREQLGAEAVRIAGDWIYAKNVLHLRPSRTGSTALRR